VPAADPGGGTGAARRLLSRGRNIYLAGFMGTGKTATARALARRLGAPWVDLDDEIERASGMTVPEIFAARGERAFRTLERAALRRVADAGGRVVALGGGAVCSAPNRELLRSSGAVVLLHAAPEVIWRRVARQGGRPLLSGPRGRERLAGLLARRRADYGRYRRRVDTGRLTPRAAAEAAIVALEPRPRRRERAAT